MERYGTDSIETYENDQSLEFLKSSDSAASENSMHRLLQGKQLGIVDNIVQAVNDLKYVRKNVFS